jgi:hypothetical protein
VAEVVDYRSIIVATQFVAWAIGQVLKLRFSVEVHRPPGLLEHGPEQCLILAPTHQSSLDPWLIMSALGYRQWRAVTPVRTLTSRSYGPPLSWFTPLVRALYRLEGAIELPPKEEGWYSTREGPGPPGRAETGRHRRDLPRGPRPRGAPTASWRVPSRRCLHPTRFGRGHRADSSVDERATVAPSPLRH